MDTKSHADIIRTINQMRTANHKRDYFGDKPHGENTAGPDGPEVNGENFQQTQETLKPND